MVDPNQLLSRVEDQEDVMSQDQLESQLLQDGGLGLARMYLQDTMDPLGINDTAYVYT